MTPQMTLSSLLGPNRDDLVIPPVLPPTFPSKKSESIFGTQWVNGFRLGGLITTMSSVPGSVIGAIV